MAIALGLLAPACVVEDEPLDGLDRPARSALATAGIVVLNGLDPAKYAAPIVQDNLPALLGKPLVPNRLTATLGSHPAGLELLPYAIRGAFPDGDGVALVDLGGSWTRYPGLIGISPRWGDPAGSGLSREEQQANVAYWGASLNLRDLNVDVQMVGAWDPFDLRGAEVDPTFDFFEAVYWVDFEGARPLIFAAPSRRFLEECGDAHDLAQGRCGRSDPAACGMVPVPVAAEKACLFDPRNPQQPVACDYRGDRSLRPIAVYTDRKPCAP